ncbi:hypothetical protein [Alicyclobacillus sp. SO9]|uniref:fascin domain-containing protein n=1 Tax=Alicyclobacillus sp. SO9 TaxID=2665646 RepID=UPI0018E8F954|nr:hypothetical protein [Alicyclobacillus sp. SO9]QQE79542.1 hypothetical protein GI364_03335 [Alicyclobacillus sp. SO9]
MASITQKQLDDFKNLFPDNPHIQALTLDEVLRNTKGKTVDWNTIQFNQPTAQPLVAPAEISLSACEKQIGYVIFDIVCLGVGAVGLRSGVNGGTVEAVAGAAAPVLNKIEVIIARMGAPGASTTDLAKGVFDILSTIWTGGCLGAVFSAFMQSLTWWDMVLYGITGTATIIAACATDGAAFVAEVVILLATFGWLVTDSVRAYQVCGMSPEPGTMPGPDPRPGTDPYPFEPVIAIQTYTGNYLTVVNNGGLGRGVSAAIETNRREIGAWEKFTLEPLNNQERTFAIRTSNGHYVTAVNGGGMGGPNDDNFPIHTDATSIGPWEKFQIVQEPDGTYTFCTFTGFYLTAVNGGGMQQNDKPISTDRTEVREWETFTIVDIPR